MRERCAVDLGGTKAKLTVCAGTHTTQLPRTAVHRSLSFSTITTTTMVRSRAFACPNGAAPGRLLLDFLSDLLDRLALAEAQIREEHDSEARVP
jgi:hypothetical protein